MTDVLIYVKITREYMGDVMMSEHKIEHNLIEYAFALLEGPDGQQDKSDGAGRPAMQEAWERQIAGEVIRFMDEMPGGMLIYRADGDEEIIYANRALLRIFQCDTLAQLQELTGNSFKGLVYHEDLEEVEKSIWEQITASQFDLDYVEYRIVRRDGEMRWVEDYGHFVHSGSAGDIFYVFIADATEKRKRLMDEKEMLLKESHQKERMLQNLIQEYDQEKKKINQEHLRRLEVIEGLSVNYESILYADLDKDQILPYRLSSRTERQFNRMYRVCGYAWYIADYANVWVHEEDREMVLRATEPAYIREKLSEGKTFYTNYRVIENDEVQYLQLRIVNVGNKDHISQIVMGYRRVDEEIRYEMEHQQMLEEALNNVKHAMAAKDTFLSNMSHDMRTPLNAIFGYTALAQKHIGNEETVGHYLGKIEASSRQLLDLISKVLEIAWTESGDIHLSECECRLNDILQSVYGALSPRASEKNISFYLSSAGLEHSDVYADQDKLRQLLMYLADNAVTYTKNDGRVDLVVVETEHLPNDYAVYQFVVRDTGIGIREEFMEHLFEPFEREKNTTISGIHGAGLGLAISRNIVEMMGGNIEVESTPGVGSTFTVTLSLRMRNQPTAVPDDTDNIIAGMMSQKILLVDDNDINLEIESEILCGLGFAVETAVNGSIAVEKVKKSKPGEYALVLMDIQMPVMNGWQAARAIRGLDVPALAGIPIIALSANAFESDKRASIESGMDAHLEKPMDVPVLLEAVAKAVGRRIADAGGRW